MSPEDQKAWEMEEMSKPIDLEVTNVKIDPSPFQLVEKTSILKVHSLFSLIEIKLAYVTKIGKLVGVVALKEVKEIMQIMMKITKNYVFCFYRIIFTQLRKAIEDVNSGNLTPNQANESPEKAPLPPQEQPLINNDCNKNVHNTISSMDSALSNSDNCSDIELGNVVDIDTRQK